MGLQALTTSVNPLTLADVKTHLRIVDDLMDPQNVAYSSDDAALLVFLAAAFEYVETETRQQLCNRDYLLTLDNFPDGSGCNRGASGGRGGNYRTDRAIKLPRPPLVSVAALEYTDAAGNPQTLDPSAYTVDATTRPGRIVLNPGYSWPHEDGSANCVRITFTAGYGDAPDVPVVLKQAILLLAGSWFENRENDITLRINSIPLGVQSIINQNMYPEAVG